MSIANCKLQIENLHLQFAFCNVCRFPVNSYQALGGGRGTTRDTFELAAQAEASGARVALFGRKINLAESPIKLVKLLRAVVERHITPTEAVKAYHDHLAKIRLAPDLTLDKDLEITDPVLKG